MPGADIYATFAQVNEQNRKNTKLEIRMHDCIFKQLFIQQSRTFEMNCTVEEIIFEIGENADAEQSLPIEEGLNNFNDLMTGISDRKPLSILIKSTKTGEVLGGMQGRSSLGLLFIDLFYLPPELRRMGLGTDILNRFEDEGRRRGCSAAFLYTISFQAPDFYKKHGWEEFGRIGCEPEGTSRIFMKKSL